MDQVLIEGLSRRSRDQLTGKTCTMKRVIIPNMAVASSYKGLLQQHSDCDAKVMLQAGDYVAVQIQDSGNATLFGRPIARIELQEFVSVHGTTTPVETYIDISSSCEKMKQAM